MRRERVLDVATPLFAAEGYRAVTVDKIAAASKTSVGGFYQCFGDREDCFIAVFDRVVDDARRRISEASRPTESWSRRAYAGLAALVDLFVAGTPSAPIVLVEAQTAGPVVVARRQSLLDEAVGWLREGRRRHPGAAGSLPDSFELAAVAGVAYLLCRQLPPSTEKLAAPVLLAEVAGLTLGPILGTDGLRRLEVRAGATRA